MNKQTPLFSDDFCSYSVTVIIKPIGTKILSQHPFTELNFCWNFMQINRVAGRKTFSCATYRNFDTLLNKFGC